MQKIGNQIDIVVPPGDPVLTTNIWLENATNIAECAASQGKPLNSYSWTLRDRTWNTGHNGRTEILATKEDHKQTLTCIVNNNYTLNKKITVLTTQTLDVECKYNYSLSSLSLR